MSHKLIRTEPNVPYKKTNLGKSAQKKIVEEFPIICPIYKKRNPINAKNYRGISLLNTAYQILSNILLNRLKSYASEIIGEYQRGFMSDRSTIDHNIFIICA